MDTNLYNSSTYSSFHLNLLLDTLNLINININLPLAATIAAIIKKTSKYPFIMYKMYPSKYLNFHFENVIHI